jgi:Spy/CpxP family protein refolding chaperone
MTDEQRKKLQEANQKMRQEQTPLYEKLRTARQDLEKAAQAENFDEQTIRAKAAVIGQIEGDLALIRARHYQEIRTIAPRAQSAGTAVRLQSIVTNRSAAAPGSTK